MDNHENAIFIPGLLEARLPISKSVKVLVVDRDPQILDLLCRYLDHPLSEFKVVVAASAEVALESILLETPMVMVASLDLPDLDGVAMVRQAHLLDPKLRVVAMVASGTEEIRSAILHEGAVRCLEKPLDLPLLFNALRDISQGPPWDPTEGLCGDRTDLLDLLQMMGLCRHSCVIQFLYGDRSGILGFEHGSLFHASTDDLHGEAAFFRMAQHREGLFHTLAQHEWAGLARNIELVSEQLMFEGARLRDEVHTAAPSADLPKPAPIQLEEVKTMSRIKDLMTEMLNTQGARVAVIVGWDGFVIEGVSRDGQFGLDALGAVISTSMGSTQVIGRELQVGNVSLAMMEFEKGTVLVRVLGKVGLLAMLVDPDTSLGLPRHQLRKWAPAMEAELA